MWWLTGGVARKKRALCRRLYSENPPGFSIFVDCKVAMVAKYNGCPSVLCLNLIVTDLGGMRSLATVSQELSTRN